jgi:ACDE family multidrug resistance protein
VTAARRPPLGLLFAVTLTGILSNSLLSPVIPDVLDHFGQSDSRAGVLVAVGALPGIVMAPLIGFAADRFGRKVVLVPCLVTFGVFGIVAATAQTFTVLLLARLAMGFGSGGLINLAVVMIGDNWSGAERTRLVGLNSAVLTLGLAVVPLSSGLITDLASWRWALALYSTALVTAGAVAMLIENVRPAQTGNVRSQIRGAFRILRQPVLIASLISGTLTFALIFGIFLATIPVHLEEEFGLSAGWRGAIIALPAIASSVVSANLGRLRRTLGLRVLLVSGSTMFVAAFLALGTTATLAILIVAVIVYGIGEGAIIPALQDTTVTVAPAAYRGGVLAVWVGFVRLGQTVGPLLAAALTGATSTSTTMVVGAGVAMMIVALKVFGPIDDQAVAAATPDPD